MEPFGRRFKPEDLTVALTDLMEPILHETDEENKRPLAEMIVEACERLNTDITLPVFQKAKKWLAVNKEVRTVKDLETLALMFFKAEDLRQFDPLVLLRTAFAMNDPCALYGVRPFANLLWKGVEKCPKQVLGTMFYVREGDPPNKGAKYCFPPFSFAFQNVEDAKKFTFLRDPSSFTSYSISDAVVYVLPVVRDGLPLFVLDESVAYEVCEVSSMFSRMINVASMKPCSGLPTNEGPKRAPGVQKVLSEDVRDLLFVDWAAFASNKELSALIVDMVALKTEDLTNANVGLVNDGTAYLLRQTKMLPNMLCALRKDAVRLNVSVAFAGIPFPMDFSGLKPQTLVRFGIFVQCFGSPDDALAMIQDREDVVGPKTLLVIYGAQGTIIPSEGPKTMCMEPNSVFVVKSVAANENDGKLNILVLEYCKDKSVRVLDDMFEENIARTEEFWYNVQPQRQPWGKEKRAFKLEGFNPNEIVRKELFEGFSLERAVREHLCNGSNFYLTEKEIIAMEMFFAQTTLDRKPFYQVMNLISEAELEEYQPLIEAVMHSARNLPWKQFRFLVWYDPNCNEQFNENDEYTPDRPISVSDTLENVFEPTNKGTLFILVDSWCYSLESFPKVPFVGIMNPKMKYVVESCVDMNVKICKIREVDAAPLPENSAQIEPGGYCFKKYWDPAVISFETAIRKSIFPGKNLIKKFTEAELERLRSTQLSEHLSDDEIMAMIFCGFSYGDALEFRPGHCILECVNKFLSRRNEKDLDKVKHIVFRWLETLRKLDIEIKGECITTFFTQGHFINGHPVTVPCFVELENERRKGITVRNVPCYDIGNIGMDNGKKLVTDLNWTFVPVCENRTLKCVYAKPPENYLFPLRGYTEPTGIKEIPPLEEVFDTKLKIEDSGWDFVTISSRHPRMKFTQKGDELFVYTAKGAYCVYWFDDTLPIKASFLKKDGSEERSRDIVVAPKPKPTPSFDRRDVMEVCDITETSCIVKVGITRQTSVFDFFRENPSGVMAAVWKVGVRNSLIVQKNLNDSADFRFDHLEPGSEYAYKVRGARTKWSEEKTFWTRPVGVVVNFEGIIQNLEDRPPENVEIEVSSDTTWNVFAVASSDTIVEACQGEAKIRARNVVDGGRYCGPYTLTRKLHNAVPEEDPMLEYMTHITSLPGRNDELVFKTKFENRGNILLVNCDKTAAFFKSSEKFGVAVCKEPLRFEVERHIYFELSDVHAKDFLLAMIPFGRVDEALGFTEISDFMRAPHIQKVRLTDLFPDEECEPGRFCLGATLCEDYTVHLTANGVSTEPYFLCAEDEYVLAFVLPAAGLSVTILS